MSRAFWAGLCCLPIPVLRRPLKEPLADGCTANCEPMSSIHMLAVSTGSLAAADVHSGLCSATPRSGAGWLQTSPVQPLPRAQAGGSGSIWWALTRPQVEPGMAKAQLGASRAALCQPISGGFVCRLEYHTRTCKGEGAGEGRAAAQPCMVRRLGQPCKKGRCPSATLARKGVAVNSSACLRVSGQSLGSLRSLTPASVHPSSAVSQAGCQAVCRVWMFVLAST